jgi:hypothetical protein
MGTNENDETSRLLMNSNNILKVESNLIEGFSSEETLSALNDKINNDTKNIEIHDDHTNLFLNLLNNENL